MRRAVLLAFQEGYAVTAIQLVVVAVTVMRHAALPAFQEGFTDPTCFVTHLPGRLEIPHAVTGESSVLCDPSYRCCVTGYPMYCVTWRTEEIQHDVLQEIQCTVLCVFQMLCYRISSVLCYLED